MLLALLLNNPDVFNWNWLSCNNALGAIMINPNKWVINLQRQF
jgi:hypothetical protein